MFEAISLLKFLCQHRKTVTVIVICLPTVHLGIVKNSLKCIPDQIGI